jgi:hypothetical protein
MQNILSIMFDIQGKVDAEEKCDHYFPNARICFQLF